MGLLRCRLVYSDLEQISTYTVGRGSKDKTTNGHMEAGGKGRTSSKLRVSHMCSLANIYPTSVKLLSCVVFKVMTVCVG